MSKDAKVERPSDLSRDVVRQYLGKIAWRRRMKIQQRANFDEKYPEDIYTAFLVSGSAYFDKEILIARKRELAGFKPWKTFDNGGAKIFRQRVPGRRYLIGADVATGRSISSEDTDYCAAVVGDLETGEEWATYRARVTPQDLAYDLDELGRYFNNAMIAVERTGDGGTTMLTLSGECGYSNVYRHREWWKRSKKTTKQLIDFEGFPTTGKTRPIALNHVNQFVADYPELIWDEQFINEALTFVRGPNGIPKAAPGCHDDTVSARWVFHFVRRVQLGWLIPWEMKSERYIPADQITEE